MPRSECPFQVGDIITIRDWDDMAKEYTCIGDHIRISDESVTFSSLMRYACNQSYEITEIKYRGWVDSYRIRFDGDQGFVFTPGMMVFASEPTDDSVDVSDEEYIAILGV